MGKQLLGHSGGLGWVSAEPRVSKGQTPPKEQIWLLLDGEAPHWWWGAGTTGEGVMSPRLPRLHWVISCWPLSLSGLEFWFLGWV